MDININYRIITIILSLLVPKKSAAFLCLEIQGRSLSRRTRADDYSFIPSSYTRSSIHNDSMLSAKNEIQLFDEAENDWNFYDNHRRAFLSSFLFNTMFFIYSTTSYPFLVSAEEEPIECKNGAIISESAVPGAYQQLCMNLPERRFSLKASGFFHNRNNNIITMY
ncbi:hypothetical protein ACHAXS_000901 [Conticribra weissflogii]